MKRLTKSLLLTVGCCSVFAGSTVALANNHSDSGWSFTLPRSQGNCYTGARLKTDKTSAYLKCNSVGKGGVRGWLQMANGQECGAPKRTVYRGQSTKITNYAYEQHGRSNVRMAIESSYTNPVRISASGVWSPDSV